MYASGTVDFKKTTFWKKYELNLTTAANVKPTKDARFVISTSRTGSYYFNLVSLFPPTYHNRPNGNRIDIMEKMAAASLAALVKMAIDVGLDTKI